MVKFFVGSCAGCVMVAPEIPAPGSDRDSAALAVIGRRLHRQEASVGDDVERLLELIQQRFGESLAAVLVYGSYLRGKRDTVLDFYALLDDYRAMPWWQALLCRLLAPNVYFLSTGTGLDAARAKCASLSLDRFEQAMRGDFHSYFWARFAQPCQLLYVRDESSRVRVHAALLAAANTFLRRVVPMLPSRLSTRDLWQRGFELTYRAELRAEKGGYSKGLIDADPDYYRDLTRLLAGPRLQPLPDDSPTAVELTQSWHNRSSDTERWQAQCSWWLRRLQGKWLSLARIAKAATMFDDPLDYILWKIERHSGIHVEPSKRQRRHPLIFAWPLLWNLYRHGAFK